MFSQNLSIYYIQGNRTAFASVETSSDNGGSWHANLFIAEASPEANDNHRHLIRQEQNSSRGTSLSREKEFGLTIFSRLRTPQAWVWRTVLMQSRLVSSGGLGRRWTVLRCAMSKNYQRRTLTSTRRQFQEVFQSQLEDPTSAALFSALHSSKAVPQTLTEKIVQKYSVGLPQGKFVKAGDYVTISPHRCMSTYMTHVPLTRESVKMADSRSAR